MKHSIRLIVMLSALGHLPAAPLSAQDLQPEFIWSRSAGGPGADMGRSIAVGPKGDVVVTGYFSDTAIFGGDTLTSVGARDAFVAKYDAGGSLLWVRHFAGAGDSDYGFGVDIDLNEMIVVVGKFDSTLVVDQHLELALFSAGGEDAFLIYLDGNGNVLDAVRGGGPNDDSANAVSFSNDGAIIMTGQFAGPSATFGGFKLPASEALGRDIFVVKYQTTDGIRAQNAIKAGGAGVDHPWGLAVDDNGGVYITGDFTNVAAFDSLMLQAAGKQDVFVAKLNPQGFFEWARRAGGIDGELGAAITVDLSGACYVTGEFRGTASFDGFQITSDGGSRDAFVASYSPTGSANWALRLGGALDDLGHSILMDPTGRLLVSGYFEGTADFGGALLNSDGPAKDAFLASYSTSEGMQWVTRAGGPGADRAWDVAVDPSGKIFLGGTFSGEAGFGSGRLTALGETDIYVARLMELSNADFTDNFEGQNADRWSPFDSTHWEVRKVEGDFEYCITHSNYTNPPETMRLGEYSLVRDHTYADFSFTSSFRITTPDSLNPNADACLVFGYQDSRNYYYAMVNRLAHATSIHRITFGRDVPLATRPDPLALGPGAHTLKLTRAGDQIDFFLDGGLLLTASDDNFVAGQVGVGSFDDAPCFDDVQITADPGANDPPIASRRLPDAELQVAVDSLVIDICEPPLFLDPDGDELSYTAQSSAPDVASASLEGCILLVKPVSAGKAIITVTAEDAASQSVSVVFQVTVQPPPNRGPVVSNPIPDTTLVAGAADLVIDLSSVFMDPDGDPLFYFAQSSSEVVAAASLMDSLLTVTPLDTGTASILVEAGDPFEEIVSDVFTVAVVAAPWPAVDFEDPGVPEPGGDVTINVNVTSALPVQEVRVFFRKGGASGWMSALVQESDGGYIATIPDSIITSRGVDYFLRITDVLGRVSTNPEFTHASLRVNVPQGVAADQPSPAGVTQNSYRLVSVPLDLENRSPKAVFEDDLGPYDRQTWRLFELTVNQTYREYPNASPVDPGRGYWLIVKEPGKSIDSGAGTSISTARPYKFTLHPGWNFIGNPFHFGVPAGQLFYMSEQPVEIRAFDGVWVDTVRTLWPFEGYAVWNGEMAVDSLFMNVDLTGFSPNPDDNTAAPGLEWWIRIRARAGELVDTDNLAGVAENAADGFDWLDRPEPPVIGEYVSVFFPHQEWQRPTSAFCTDIRLPTARGQAWDFHVNTNVSGPATLSFEELDRVPGELEVRLLDHAHGMALDLRNRASYTFTAPEGGQARSFTLLAGDVGYVEQQLEGLVQLPTTFVLAQNFPNPFSPAKDRNTTLRFGLPEVAQVTLQIFNLLGEKVATLVPGQRRKAGYHTAAWDGHNDQGRPVGNGVYLYRLKGGGVTITKKMAIIN